MLEGGCAQRPGGIAVFRTSLSDNGVAAAPSTRGALFSSKRARDD